MLDIKPFKNQHYQTIKRQHNIHNTFVDREFPPTHETLSHTGRRFQDLHWRRATEITPNPQFVIKSFHRGDLDQGELGNCWFLAAAGALTLHPDLLERVVQPNQTFNTNDYAGIFHFRFWINGQWYDVVIDDFLPCKSDGRLVFCRNTVDKNEMWGPLLEKAYAKVCGSYEAMESGCPVDGLIDMTGGIEELFSLHENEQGKFHDKEEIKHLITQAYQHKSMIGCAINAERGGMHDGRGGSEGRLTNGLLTGHAYSVTGVAEVRTYSGHMTLIRCLNPWGNETEWKGQFSDNSHAWNQISDEEKQRLNLKKRDDGEFWMSFDDFFNNFDQLSICHRGPSSLCTNNSTTWNENIFHGKWIRGSTAGGCGNDDSKNFFKNPQYLVRLNCTDRSSNMCTMIVALMQKDARQRLMRGIKEMSIGFALYKINDNVDIRGGVQQGNSTFNREQLKRVDNSGSYINKRQVTKRFTVPPGNYILIPSTFHPNEEGEFLIRVFTEQEAHANVPNQGHGNISESNIYDDNDARSRFRDTNDSYPNPSRNVPHGFHDNSPNPYGGFPHGFQDNYSYPPQDFSHGFHDNYPNPYQGYPPGNFPNPHQGYPPGNLPNPYQGYPPGNFPNPYQGYPPGNFPNPHQGYPPGNFPNPHQGFPGGFGGRDSGSNDFYDRVEYSSNDRKHQPCSIM